MRAIVAALVVASAIVGCSDDGASNAQSADAAMATALCGALREQTNALVRIANDAVAGIGASAPESRRASILAGFDAAEVAAAAFAEGIADLDLPSIDEADELRAEVERGARLGVEEVAEERTLFAEQVPGAIADDDVRGRVGQFFNSIEKVMSVAEPAIAEYERRDLQRAFLDEPTCRHVIQQFRMEGE
jgi:hypothetical protein